MFINEPKKENNELVTHTTQLKLTASDGKKYNTDVISQDGVDKLAKATTRLTDIV